MGRLIDADKAISDYAHYGISHSYDVYDLENILDVYDLEDILTKCPTVEAIPKDQYENRLKADLKAILVELQLEIEKLDSRAGYDGYGMPTFSTDYIRKKKVNELIQQKINELKGKVRDKE